MTNTEYSKHTKHTYKYKRRQSNKHTHKQTRTRTIKQTSTNTHDHTQGNEYTYMQITTSMGQIDHKILQNPNRMVISVRKKKS